MSEALTWLLPVATADVPTLRERIAALGEGDDSPFAEIPGAHVGRLVVLEELEEPKGGPPPGPFLLLAVDADPPAAAAVAALATRLRAVLELCEGCPDVADGDRFDRWIKRHRVPDGFSIRPFPDASVGDVRAALALRERLGAFAVWADGRAPAELRAAFRERFPELVR